MTRRSEIRRARRAALEARPRAAYEYIGDVISWKTFSLPKPPWSDADPHNPSILRVPDDADGPLAGKWLCNIRASSYPPRCPETRHWPNHPSFRSHHAADARADGARSMCSHTRNWLAELDPSNGWAAINAREIADGRPPTGTGNYVGYEDLRLAWSPKDGLVATGSTFMHNTQGYVEIVLLELSPTFEVMGATPIRGWWSEECQKNWSPFLGQPSLRWLYSPASGGVVDQHGAGMAERRTWDPALCGGTQLVPVPNTAGHFLGIGHGFDPLPGGGRRYYHRAFMVTDGGIVFARSRPLKLSEQEVDFACGLAVDPAEPDHAIVTYGVGNRESRLAQTSLSALIALCEVCAC